MPRAFIALLLLMPCFSRPVRAASACGARGMREKQCACPPGSAKKHRVQAQSLPTPATA
jgi:hypothetical protein